MAYKDKFPALFRALARQRPDFNSPVSEMIAPVDLLAMPASSPDTSSPDASAITGAPARSGPSRAQVQAAAAAGEAVAEAGDAAKAAEQARITQTVALGRGQVPPVEDRCVVTSEQGDDVVMSTADSAKGGGDGGGVQALKGLGGGGGGRCSGGGASHVENVVKYVEEVRRWLQQQPHHTLPLVSFNSLTCGPQIVRAVQDEADKYVAKRGAGGSNSRSGGPDSSHQNPVVMHIAASRVLVPVKPGLRSLFLSLPRSLSFSLSSVSQRAH